MTSLHDLSLSTPCQFAIRGFHCTFLDFLLPIWPWLVNRLFYLIYCRFADFEYPIYQAELNDCWNVCMIWNVIASVSNHIIWSEVILMWDLHFWRYSVKTSLIFQLIPVNCSVSWGALWCHGWSIKLIKHLYYTHSCLQLLWVELPLSVPVPLTSPYNF